MCRGGLPGFGAVPGRSPARGWDGCAGRGRDSGPGGCAGAGLQGLAAVCPGGVLAGAGGFSRAAGQKLFQKGPTRMYKEAVDLVSARLVDKAMFPAILWWV